MRDRRKSLGVPSNLIWVLGDFDKIFRIDDFVWSMYGEKSFFRFFFFFLARYKLGLKILQPGLKKIRR